MEFMEWTVICRVCLQEGEMQSLYEKDEKNVTICEKILKCSNITIKRGMNLPEQICKKCLDDLNVAFKFRVNCESSDAILQSFIEGNAVTDLIMSSESGVIYQYKPPQGLNVKRIRGKSIKTEAVTSDTDQNNEIENFEQIDDDQNNSIEDDQNYVQEVEELDDVEEITSDPIPSFYIQKDDEMLVEVKGDEKYENSGVKFTIKNIETFGSAQETYQITDIESQTIKPVKTNKRRVKVEGKSTVTTAEDGTTIIRVARHVVEDQKPLKICEICGNTYKYKHALESHMRRHRNEKPFSCEICGRSFVINFELRRHMRTHTGQKPYACRFCGRRFSDFGSRIKHERTHTGERPYSCETCGKSFAYSHVLSSHILTHTGEKRYGCTQCGKRFTKSHHLKAHLNTHLRYLGKTINIKTEKQLIEDLDNPEQIECTETVPTTESFQNSETIIQNSGTSVIYETNDKVYEEVLTVLTA